jgi:hypothetical protein
MAVNSVHMSRGPRAAAVCSCTLSCTCTQCDSVMSEIKGSADDLEQMYSVM